MIKLRVLVRFRDERNFFTIHEEGDIIEVSNPERVTRLIDSGLCELVNNNPTKTEESDSKELEGGDTEQIVEEKPKRTYRRKK